MKLLYSEAEIKSQNRRVAGEIVTDYAGKRPLIVTVLRGSMFFTSDLTREIAQIQSERNANLKTEIDVTTVSSYKHGLKSGDLKLVQDLDSPVEGRDILVVEDILDSGRTLKFLCDYYRMRQAKSIEVAVLIRKKRVSLAGFGDPKYVCFEYGDDDFLVGYGLDNKGFDRNLPAIYKMEESDIKAAPGA